MSHFGRSGPPDISDTYSLLVLNISFRQYLPPPLSLSLSLLRFFAFLEFPLRRVCVLRVLISSCDLGMVQVQLLMICSRSSTSTGRLLMYSSPGTEGLFSLAFLTTSLFSVLFFFCIFCELGLGLRVVASVIAPTVIAGCCGSMNE